MTKEIVYIGLGSNLATPKTQITTARQAIVALAGVAEYAFSSLYSSPPLGSQSQPDYINAVIAIETRLSAKKLLHKLQQIELDHGRVRKNERWGARTLDLDILLYGQQIINQTNLIVPHYALTERAFVLYPLYEIAPVLKVPCHGYITELIATRPLDGLVRLTG